MVSLRDEPTVKKTKPYCPNEYSTDKTGRHAVRNLARFRSSAILDQIESSAHCLASRPMTPAEADLGPRDCGYCWTLNNIIVPFSILTLFFSELRTEP